MEAFIAGAWRTLGRGEILIGGQWKRLTRAEGYIGGEWRTIAAFVPNLSVAVEPFYAEGFVNPPHASPEFVTTNVVTATPSGGLGPYSYYWTAGNSRSTASTSFTLYVPGDTEIRDSAIVTVTDALGATASAVVETSFFNLSQGG